MNLIWMLPWMWLIGEPIITADPIMRSPEDGPDVIVESLEFRRARH